MQRIVAETLASVNGDVRRLKCARQQSDGHIEHIIMYMHLNFFTTFDQSQEASRPKKAFIVREIECYLL